MAHHADVIEFSLYSSTNPNGYDDTPDFEKQCWPLLQAQGGVIGRVLVVRDRGVRRAGFLTEELQRGTTVTNDVSAIGRLAELGARALGDVRTLAGEFDFAVFFELPADSALSVGLLGLWRRPGEVLEAVSSLGVTELEAVHIGAVAEAIAEGNIAVAFHTEGTAMIVVAPSGVRAQLRNVRFIEGAIGPGLPAEGGPQAE